MADMCSLTVACAVQKVRGGKSVTQDPDVRKEIQFEPAWILIFIFHPVSVFNLDSITHVDNWTFRCI